MPPPLLLVGRRRRRALQGSRRRAPDGARAAARRTTRRRRTGSRRGRLGEGPVRVHLAWSTLVVRLLAGDKVGHASAPDEPLSGGPQMVEVSRDGRRVHLSNSLYGARDDQFNPGGMGAWLAKLDVPAAGDGLTFDERFFPHGAAWRGPRPHQVRLQGGTRPRTRTATREVAG